MANDVTMVNSEKQDVEGSAERDRRGPVRGRDWTKGSITRNLLSLSWPMLISNALRMIGPTIDMIWVGKLGAASIAGVGLASIAVFVMMSGRQGINTGMRAMAARFMGAGDTEGANHVAQQALVISAVYAVVMGAIGIIFAKPILTLLGVEADVVAEGAAYMRIMFAGTAATSFGLMAEGIMQASGDTMTPMRISVLTRFFHVALCPFLIFGWWIFPRLGVSGAAMTNVVAQCLGMALGLWILFSGRSRLRLTLRNFRLDLNILWRIVRIGIPASGMMVQRGLGRLVFAWFMVPFGTLAVAGHTLMGRISAFLDTPGFAFGRAGGVLVGQNLGSQQPGRAERSAWWAVGFTEAIMLICSAVMLVWPGNIIRIFNSDPELVELASVFLRIAVVGYAMFGFNTVLMECLSGAGDTLPPMLFSIIRTWVVPVPLAFLLPRVTSLGVYGVRWAIAAGTIAGPIAYAIYFRLGRWKRKRV